MAFIALSSWAIPADDKLGSEPSAIPKTTPPGPLTEAGLALDADADGLAVLVFLAVAGSEAMARGAAVIGAPSEPSVPGVCGTVPRVGLGPIAAGVPAPHAVS